MANPEDFSEHLDPKFVRDTLEGIKRVGENRDFLEENLPLLKALYPGQWIAICDGKVLGPASYDDIFGILEENGDPKSAIVTHLTPTPLSNNVPTRELL